MREEQKKTLNQHIKSAYKGKQVAMAEQFFQDFYAHTSDDDINYFSNELLFELASNCFSHLCDFDGVSPKISIDNQGNVGYLTVISLDKPFLVDSLQMVFSRNNVPIQFMAHPLFLCQFNGKNQLKEIVNQPSEDAVLVSVIYIQFEPLSKDKIKAIQSDINSLMKDIDMATSDWQSMVAKLDEVIEQVQSTKNLPQTIESVMAAIDFLKWLPDGNFTFLGYREYEYKKEDLYTVPKSGLGVLRDNGKSEISQSFAKLPKRLKQKLLAPDLLLLSKSNNLSKIHRPAYMDFIGVKRFNDSGEVIGEHRFIGLFTSEVYRVLPKEIPLVEQKVKQIIKDLQLPSFGHAARQFENIITQMPRDELLQATTQEIQSIAEGVFQLRDRDVLRFFARRDVFETYVMSYVFIPKERYNTKLRVRIENYLVEELGGYASEYSTHFNESAHVRLRVIVRTHPGKIKSFNTQAIENKIKPMMLDWGDETKKLLVNELGLSEGNSLFSDIEKSIPLAFKEDFVPEIATQDILALNQLNTENIISANLYQRPSDNDCELRLKLYGLGDMVELSALLPVLENFGFRVKSASPYLFTKEGENSCWLVRFKLRMEKPLSQELPVISSLFLASLKLIWTDTHESDELDKLVVQSAFKARDVNLLRAISKYMLQAKAPYSNHYMQQAVIKNSEIAANLVELFYARLGISVKNRDNKEATLLSTIKKQLINVASLDEDKILKWFLAVICAVVRTNFFQKNEQGLDKDYLSFKIESAKIEGLPLPKPLFEIFVYSAEVEAIHLRGGKVARGGLRWSDRLEDFRTEVLGLVKAQIVKNAVIVPAGSKGGFIVKKPDNSSRDAFMNKGIACYKTFMRGLLDVTDNLVKGKVVPPELVHRRDEDDPYLVVAADKGTATFSDIANNISEEYGFWLGDAFASGGSVGYDHKGMGITAKGAWESVKRHFRHLGKDIQKEVFTVVGIGDMGGDVFGNGMLLSKKIQLTAAFNHLHIFIDPNPSADKTYKERKRLFETPKTTWDDFNKTLISKGGGVFSRQEKAIQITPEMQKTFAIKEDSLSPNELINRLLKAPVDLIWNGGIGTYIKAEEESHESVGDKANDILRVNGCELNCKVIGEGGNLGATQLGRIEYAKKGGLVLTDAIDNSAGVNCSDHEVNIKVLLGQLIEKGKIKLSERNKLLESMTDEVSNLVLRQNYQQPQAISIGVGEKSLFVDYVRIIKNLEKSGRLNRELEFLPSDDELKKRAENDEGFYGPELAVLLAYSKIQLFDELIESNLPDHTFFQKDITLYFPSKLRDSYASEMKNHRLNREIITTFVTNSILNHMGAVFMHRTKEITGQSSDQIVLAYCISRDVFGARNYWKAIDTLDNQVDAELQNQLHLRIRHLLEKSVNWLLTNYRQKIDIEKLQADFSEVSVICKKLPKIVSDEVKQQKEVEIKQLVTVGLNKSLASDFAYMDYWSNALDILKLATQNKAKAEAVTTLYFDVGKLLNSRWVGRGIDALYNNDFWRRRACFSLRERLEDNLRVTTQNILSLDKTPAKAFTKWQKNNESVINAYQQFMDEIIQEAPDLSRISVIIGEMAVLARN